MAKGTIISTPVVNKSSVGKIQNLLRQIDSEILSGGTGLYFKNREIIKSLFTQSIPYSKDVVYERLIFIDALYSTNMDRRYYGLEQMADYIFNLSTGNAGNKSDNVLREKVRDFRDTLINNCPSAVDKHCITGVFDTNFGIQKNLNPAGKAMSLLSKYFYFLLLVDPNEKIGFPIYDSLAQDMYPVVCNYLYGPTSTHLTIVKDVKNIGHLCDYFAALNQLRTSLMRTSLIQPITVKLQEFDLLDAYLWRMGKFHNNNFSLLLDETQYISLVKAAGAKGVKDVTKYINIYRTNPKNTRPITGYPLFTNLWNHATNDLKI